MTFHSVQHPLSGWVEHVDASPSDKHQILVSIIIPCFEEKTTIANCLDAILANDFPKCSLEVLVVDGLSNDGTRECISSYVSTYPFIRLVDNPQQLTSCALNCGIRLARGKYILILSGHIVVHSDFTRRTIEAMQDTNADGVGGIIRAQPRSHRHASLIIAALLSSRFAVGNSYFRVGVQAPREVDTVPYGCYHRSVFQNGNVFNERLTRNQDLEFNLRLKHKGGKLFLCPAIQSTYYAPETVSGFLRQNFRNGFWITYGLASARSCFSIRHLVPLASVLVGTATLIAAVVYPPVLWLGFTLAGLYGLMNLYFSIQLSLQQRSLLTFWYSGLFLLLHLSYGFGSLCGALALLVKRVRGHDV